MTYRHIRSYHTHHPGSGWTRTKVRYKTGGGHLQAWNFELYDNSFLGWLRNGTFNTRDIKPWNL
jgi:hypothetical protein